jgi:hypothetical protein
MLSAVLRRSSAPLRSAVGRRFVAMPPIRHHKDDITFTYKNDAEKEGFSFSDGAFF